MLPYSLSFNKVRSIPPLKLIVSAKIVERLWDTNAFIPEEHRTARDWKYWDNALTQHREQTIRSSIALTEESDLPFLFKTVFKENVFSRCRAYQQFLRWKRSYDRRDKMCGRVKANLLIARHYFTVSGEFDDLAWTKRVVLDPLFPLTSRFKLACKYCLENETALLWSEMKNNDSVPFNGDMSAILNRMDDMTAFWIFHLENRLEDLAQHPRFAGDVYVEVFRRSAVRGYEHATRYFWKKMVDPEKITEDEMFFELMDDSAVLSENVTVFLYSQLSRERKQKLLDWYIELKKDTLLWEKLLLSLYTEAERSEIIELVYKLPFDQYFGVLFGILAIIIMEHSYPVYLEDVFEALWAHQTPENRVKALEKGPCIIRRLIAANKLDIVDFVMKSLSTEQKEKYFSTHAMVAGVR